VKAVKNSKRLKRFTRIQKEGTVKAVKNSKRLKRFIRTQKEGVVKVVKAVKIKDRVVAIQIAKREKSENLKKNSVARLFNSCLLNLYIKE